MTETLANGYSDDSNQGELSNEYQHVRVLKTFKIFCVLVPLKKVASASKGLIQVNLDMTDPVGPGKLVRYMQNLSYAYGGLCPLFASVYAIALGTSFYRYKSQNSERICLAGLILYMYLSATRTTRRCELSAVWPNVTKPIS